MPLFFYILWLNTFCKVFIFLQNWIIVYILFSCVLFAFSNLISHYYLFLKVSNCLIFRLPPTFLLQTNLQEISFLLVSSHTCISIKISVGNLGSKGSQLKNVEKNVHLAILKHISFKGDVPVPLLPTMYEMACLDNIEYFQYL